MSEKLEEKKITCPYCGEIITLFIDTSVSEQGYTEDCSVCCQPISLEVIVDDTDAIEVYSRQENE